MTRVAARVEAIAIPGVPIVQPGDDLAALIDAAIARAELARGDAAHPSSPAIKRPTPLFRVCLLM